MKKSFREIFCYPCLLSRGVYGVFVPIVMVILGVLIFIYPIDLILKFALYVDVPYTTEEIYLRLTVAMLMSGIISAFFISAYIVKARLMLNRKE